MGRVRKGEGCGVEGCGERAVRSLPGEVSAVLERAGLKVAAKRGRVYLCEKHYKSYKKLVKRERKAERWRTGAVPR